MLRMKFQGPTPTYRQVVLLLVAWKIGISKKFSDLIPSGLGHKTTGLPVEILELRTTFLFRIQFQTDPCRSDEKMKESKGKCFHCVELNVPCLSVKKIFRLLSFGKHLDMIDNNKKEWCNKENASNINRKVLD